MDKKLVRLIVLLCALALLAAGCAPTVTPGAAPTDTQAAQPGAPSTEPEAQADVDPLFALAEPLVPEKITIKAIASINSFVKTPFDQFTMWGIMEKATNIHWEVEGIPANSYEDKVTLMISGNDLPEVLMSPGADIRGKYYTTGQFLPLNDLIEVHAPAIAAVYADPVVRANNASSDGQIYITPSGEIAPWLDDENEFFINGEWLETLGLTVPTDLDGFSAALKAFKDSDPNGNGLADEIPMMISIKRGDLMRFMGWFGLPINYDYEMQREGQFIYGPTQVEFRRALEYFHTLYADGLLDAESLTQEHPEMMAKGATIPPVVGSFVGFWANDYCPPETAKQYVALPPVKGGTDGEPVWLARANMPGPGGMVITTNCQNPEAAIRWANYVVEDPRRTFEIAEGPLSSGLIRLSDAGKYELNDGAQPEGMTFNEWSFANALRTSIPWFLLTDDVLAIREIAGETAYKTGLVEQFRPYFYNEPLTAAHLSNYDSEELRQDALTIATDMKTIIQEFISQSLMNGITDKSWEAFQDTLTQARVEKLIELRQHSLDVFSANFN